MKPVNPNLTPNQRAILSYITGYFAEYGYTPSYREIGERFALKSGGSVAQYLEALEAKGYISRGDGSRQILLNSTLETKEMVEIPLLGVIAAGVPIEPLEDPQPISVPKTMLPTSGMAYALRVKGDSMVEDGIWDGDFILVRHQKDADNGDIVVAITEDGATLKRFYRKNGKVCLEPRNPNLEPFFPKQLEIRGKFMGLIRCG
jgi:repressor LexA